MKNMNAAIPSMTSKLKECAKKILLAPVSAFNALDDVLINASILRNDMTKFTVRLHKLRIVFSFVAKCFLLLHGQALDRVLGRRPCGILDRTV